MSASEPVAERYVTPVEVLREDADAGLVVDVPGDEESGRERDDIGMRRAEPRGQPRRRVASTASAVRSPSCGVGMRSSARMTPALSTSAAFMSVPPTSKASTALPDPSATPLDLTAAGDGSVTSRV